MAALYRITIAGIDHGRIEETGTVARLRFLAAAAKAVRLPHVIVKSER